MKAFKFMLSACVAAVALTSCEKEEFVPQVQETRLKSVEISLENLKFSSTRGTAGEKIKSGDSVLVKDFKIFLTDRAGNEYHAKVADGSRAAQTYWSGAELSEAINADFHYVDNGCIKVVAVANLGEDMTYAQFKQMSNLKIDNEQKQEDLSLYAEKELVRSNKQHTDFNATDSITYVADVYEAALTLRPRISRLEVDGFRVKYNDPIAHDTIIVTDLLFDHYALETSLETGIETNLHEVHIAELDNQALVYNWFNDADKAKGWWWDSFAAAPLVMTPDAPAADVEDASGNKTPLAYHFFSGTVQPRLIIKLIVDGQPAYLYSKGFYSTEKMTNGNPTLITEFEEGKIYRMNAAGEVDGNKDGSIPIDEDDIDPMDRCLEISVDVVDWVVELVFPEF